MLNCKVNYGKINGNLFKFEHKIREIVFEEWFESLSNSHLWTRNPKENHIACIRQSCE